MSKQDFEQHLREQIEHVPDSIQPEKDLWSGIDIALTMRAAGAEQVSPSKTQVSTRSNVISADFFGSPKVYALAASFFAVAAISWNLTQTPQVTDASLLVEAMTQQHSAQKDALLVSVAETQPLTQDWQQQLNDLEAAALAIRTALEKEPDNVALLKMLQQVHQQQIDLIERVHSPQWNRI